LDLVKRRRREASRSGPSSAYSEKVRKSMTGNRCLVHAEILEINKNSLFQLCSISPVAKKDSIKRRRTDSTSPAESRATISGGPSYNAPARLHPTAMKLNQDWDQRPSTLPKLSTAENAPGKHQLSKGTSRQDLLITTYVNLLQKTSIGYSSFCLLSKTNERDQFNIPYKTTMALVDLFILEPRPPQKH
jgi:hypothetical protein